MVQIGSHRAGMTLAALLIASTATIPSVSAQSMTATPAFAQQETRPSQATAQQDHVAMLVGRWGDDGDCTTKTTTQFNADGTFHSFASGGDGHWTLNGNRLTMQGGGGVFNLVLHWIDADHMDVENPDGSMGHSQRC